ncbi:hypothetical protein AC579_3350 [Pseudocercospora musae]|uniref:Uncharacterized protein n=1 Tax=Pseudocercospora musae TaxID=113226 RepID=A0A139GVK6_9PEZI|nr:hypothetical protein AC579_3350 [Pseudocercospora musae]
MSTPEVEKASGHDADGRSEDQIKQARGPKQEKSVVQEGKIDSKPGMKMREICDNPGWHISCSLVTRRVIFIAVGSKTYESRQEKLHEGSHTDNRSRITGPKIRRKGTFRVSLLSRSSINRKHQVPNIRQDEVTIDKPETDRKPQRAVTNSSSPSINSLMPSSFAQTRTTPQNQVNSAIPPAIPPSPVYMFFQTDRSLLVYILVSRDDSTHRTSVPRVRIICAAMRRTPKINRWTHTGPESSMTPEERIAIALWRSMYGIQIIRNLMWLGGDM